MVEVTVVYGLDCYVLYVWLVFKNNMFLLSIWTIPRHTGEVPQIRDRKLKIGPADGLDTNNLVRAFKVYRALSSATPLLVDLNWVVFSHISR